MSINRNKRHKVYATLPVLDEINNISDVITNLLEQEEVDLHLIFCVNQPDEWWDREDKLSICLNNKKTIDYIHLLDDHRIVCIDRSSKGNGWIGRKHGVGWARKTAMDAAAEMADDNDIIISVDADTYYPDGYFKAVADTINHHKEAAGLSVPYYHPLTGDEMTDRCVLRYEIYMRNFALNMLLIQNPYCFSAIGSGMACSARMYKKVGGLTPKMSGEDFYFVQKLRKAGNIIIDFDKVIYPASRFSDRVYFGTGPAMIKGRKGNWDSYPIYPQELFNDVKTTFSSIPALYVEEISTPMDTFLTSAFGLNEDEIEEIWQPLRINSPSVEQFTKAAMQKVDGLKILQYLKGSCDSIDEKNEERLSSFILNNFQPDDSIMEALDQIKVKGFNTVPVTVLNLVRDFLFVMERKLQHKIVLA